MPTVEGPWVEPTRSDLSERWVRDATFPIQRGRGVRCTPGASNRNNPPKHLTPITSRSVGLASIFFYPLGLVLPSTADGVGHRPHSVWGRRRWPRTVRRSWDGSPGPGRIVTINSEQSLGFLADAPGRPPTSAARTVQT